MAIWDHVTSKITLCCLIPFEHSQKHSSQNSQILLRIIQLKVRGLFWIIWYFFVEYVIRISWIYFNIFVGLKSVQLLMTLKQITILVYCGGGWYGCNIFSIALRFKSRDRDVYFAIMCYGCLKWGYNQKWSLEKRKIGEGWDFSCLNSSKDDESFLREGT